MPIASIFSEHFCSIFFYNSFPEVFFRGVSVCIMYCYAKRTNYKPILVEHQRTPWSVLSQEPHQRLALCRRFMNCLWKHLKCWSSEVYALDILSETASWNISSEKIGVMQFLDSNSDSQQPHCAWWGCTWKKRSEMRFFAGSANHVRCLTRSGISQGEMPSSFALPSPTAEQAFSSIQSAFRLQYKKIVFAVYFVCTTKHFILVEV